MTSGQKNGLLVGLAAVALIGAGVLFLRSSSSASASLPHTQTVHGVCLSCKTEATLTAPLSDHDPYACPKCGKRSLYPLYYCADCQKRFVPNLSRPTPGEAPRVPISVTCPACTGGNVAPFDSEMIPADSVKGDLPLPKWEP